MGSDPDAFLYFGFDIHSDDDYDKEKPECLEDDEKFYATKIGIVDDSGMFTAEGQYAVKKGTPEHTAADEKFGDYCRRKREAWAAAGGEINFWGSDESQTHYAYIEQFNTDWEQSIEIPPELPVISAERIDKFKQFCEIMEIPWQEPKWRLAARWF